MSEVLASVEAVIFDMDGLMLDTEKLGFEYWTEACERHGFVLPREAFLKMVGRTIHDAKKQLMAAMGPDFPFEEVRQTRVEVGERRKYSDGVPLKPGLLSLLSYLEQQGVPKAVATSSGREYAEFKLRTSELYDRFSTVITRNEITKGKPDPEIFLKAGDGLGGSPERCLVLEDSEPGIEGAHRAGMIPIMVPDLIQPGEETKSRALRVLPSLEMVEALLRKHR